MNTTTGRMYPALSLMEKNCPPLYRTRQPYWRAPAAAPAGDVYVPTWNWHGVADTTDAIPEGAEIITLDANGSWLGAMTGATIAHDQLQHVGAPEYLPDPTRVPPGYYRIDVPYWAFSASIVHPLGNSPVLQAEKTVWVCGPTLVLLLELLRDGSIGDLQIHDAWIGRVGTSFRAWGAALKLVRNQRLDALDVAHPEGRPEGCDCGACDAYNGFKEGYGAAMSMMLTGKGCKTHRPDWTQHVYAQHAASQWRKAWRFIVHGDPLIRMGDVDEIAILRADLKPALGRTRPPFRFDGTGRDLGAFKIKVKTEDQRTPTTIAVVDDTTDLL